MDSVSIEPDMHSPVAIGAFAFCLALTNLLGQWEILCRYLHSLYISIVTTARDAEEAAHLADAVFLPVAVDHLVFDAGLHSFPVSERKSRSNSFSIFSRCISYACSATMPRGVESFLGRPFGRGVIPAAIRASFRFSLMSSW